MLKALPPDWNAPHHRPEIQQAVGALQDLNAGSPMQLSQEVMDVSRSVVATSEVAASETPSERQERQATEGIMMSGPESVQETGDEDDDDYDDEEESDEDEDEEESEESQMAEAKGAKLSGGGGEPKGKGIS